jgi:co-chaperonin GroES (HSP10)
MDDEKKRLPSKRQEHKKIRRVSPIGFRVLVRVEKEASVTDSGLYLPEGAKQSAMESLICQVMEVASAAEHDSDEDTNISGIPLGAWVLIAKHAGVKVPWDETLRLVDTKDVLATIEEISLT